MVYLSKKKWRLLHITPSTENDKKYRALFVNRTNDSKYKSIYFGDKRYTQFHDKLGFYKNLNNNDVRRREAFLARHSHNVRSGYFSASQLSIDYLW